MFREMLSPNHRIKLPTAMNMLHAMGTILALVILANAFSRCLGIRWPGYIAYALIAVIVVLLYRREVNQWVLEIRKGRIQFLSRAGMRERLLVEMPLSAVDAFTPLPDTPIEKPCERFCSVKGPQKPWLITGTTAEGKACRVIFCPSGEAVAALKEQLDKNG